MSGSNDFRTPRPPQAGGDQRKRSLGVGLGVLGLGLVGGYGLMGLGQPRCPAPPAAGTPDALALSPEELLKKQQEYEQCRRRRSASSSSSSRSSSRSWSSSSPSRSSISRGGFGRSGVSFGG